jgi:uncharacterized protein YutE (UPF0331/DUF86 family)
VTDRGLVLKKLARIESCLADLDRVPIASIASDVVHERFVEHTLQLAIQAAQDVASHIVSDDQLGDPATSRRLFDLLAQHGWIPPDLVPPLHRMVGFRNVIVHEYDDVDLDAVRAIAEHHVVDLRRYVDAIRARVGHA